MCKDAVEANQERGSKDPNFKRLRQILEGATRSPRDPDTQLAILVADLRDADEEQYQVAIAELLADEDTN